MNVRFIYKSQWNLYTASRKLQNVANIYIAAKTTNITGNKSNKSYKILGEEICKKYSEGYLKTL